MDFFAATERLMTMDDATWARHANPISVYSRFTTLPLLTLAVWSRVWLGWWCLIPIILTMLWIWYNPRAFSPPKSTKNWASRVTFGERLYLNRKMNPIPDHHNNILKAITTLATFGVVILIYRLTSLNVWATVCGLLLSIVSKLWFVDRMVWLYMENQFTK